MTATCVNVQAQSYTLADTQRLPHAEVTAIRVKPAFVFESVEIDTILQSYMLMDGMDRLLENTTPIFIKDYGPGSLSTPTFRGANANHTKIYWNGLELNSPLLGQVDLALVPMLGASSIHVHHGNASTVDGFGGIGGSIRISSDPVRAQPGLQVHQQIGSFGDYRTGTQLALQKGKWHSLTHALWHTARNDFEYVDITRLEKPSANQEHAAFEQYGVQQDLSYRISANQSIAAHVRYSTTDRELPVAITSEPQGEEQEDKVLLASVEYKRQQGRSTFHLTSGWVSERITYTNPAASIRSEARSNGFKNQWRWHANWSDRWSTSSSLFVEYDRGTQLNWDEPRELFRRAALLAVNYQPTRFLRLYAHAKPTWVGESVEPFLPAIGFHTNLIPAKLIWKGSLSQNFNYPTLNDRYWIPGGNPDLEPEGGWTIESTLEGGIEKKGWRASYSLTGYHSLVEQLIQWVPVTDNIWQPQNVRTVRMQGLEGSIELGFPLFKRWGQRFMAQYSYTESTTIESDRTQDPALDKQLIYVPLHNLNWRSVTTIGQFQAHVSYQFVSRRYIESTNETHLPAYDLIDLGISKRFPIDSKRALVVQGEVRNVLNKRYMNLAWRPMPGIHYALRITYQTGW